MTDSIQEALLKAVDIVIDKRIADSNFSTTIKGTIVNQITETAGNEDTQYKVRYDMGYITATGPGNKYINGQSVYILKNKVEGSQNYSYQILGLAPENQSTDIIKNEVYDYIGGSIISGVNKQNTYYVPVDQAEKYELILYDSNSNNNLVNVDNKALRSYLEYAKKILLTARFSTGGLTSDYVNKSAGIFGISITYTTTTAESNTIEFSSNEMNGNPFLYTGFIEQNKYFEPLNIKEIIKVVLYVKNFTTSDKEPISSTTSSQTSYNCIGFQLPRLFMCKVLEKTDDYYLSTQYVNDISQITEITANNATTMIPVQVKASLYYQNNIVTSNCHYVWGIEDSTITASSDNYDVLLGENYRVIKNSDNNIFTFYDGNSTSVEGGIPLYDYRNIIKIVGYYQDKAIAASNTVVILNQLANHELTLSYEQKNESTGDDQDDQYVRYLVFTANIETLSTTTEEVEAEEELTTADKTNYFHWTITDDKNQNIQTGEWLETATTKIKLEAVKQYSYITVHCDYTDDTSQETIVVKASRELRIYYLGETNDYSVEILYDDTRVKEKIVMYDEMGRLMNNIQGITAYCRVLDKAGNQLSPTSYTTIWNLSSNSSMIKIAQQDSEETKETSYLIGQDETTKEHYIKFNVSSNYDGNKSNNRVSCTITINNGGSYQGATYTGNSDIIISKVGDNGNNGNDNVYSMRAADTGAPYLIYKMPSNYRIGLNTIKTDITRYCNGKKFDWETTDKLQLASYPKGSKYIGDEKIVDTDPIKLLVTDGYTYFPIILVNGLTESESTSAITIIDTGYPSEVIYTSSGDNPYCDTYCSFNNIKYWYNNKSNNFTWDFYFCGEEVTEKQKNSNYSYIDDNGILHPAAHFNCGNQENYALGTYEINDNSKVTIYVPVFFHLNRHELQSANKWDGTSICINEDDNYIAAPQILAGAKTSYASNLFTGVALGEKVTVVTTSSTTTSEIGLFGYDEGKETFFLNAEESTTEKSKRNSHIGNWCIGENYLYNDKGEGLTSRDNEGWYGPEETKHGCIPHDQQGVMLSSDTPYISVKGRTLTAKDINTSSGKCVVEVGDTFELELDPNASSLFTIYRHFKSSGSSILDSREKKVGIDTNGRFYTNSLKDSGAALSLSTIAAFGKAVDTANNYYRGLDLEAGKSSDNTQTFIKLFTHVNSTSPVTRISTSKEVNNEYSTPLAVHAKSISLYAYDGETTTTSTTTTRYIKINTDGISIGGTLTVNNSISATTGNFSKGVTSNGRAVYEHGTTQTNGSIKWGTNAPTDTEGCVKGDLYIQLI